MKPRVWQKLEMFLSMCHKPYILHKDVMVINADIYLGAGFDSLNNVYDKIDGGEY
jgi:hypothetical protein